MAPGKRTGAAKGSRHNKKYWRKGTNIEEIEDAIHTKSRQKETGGVISEMKDEEIFMIDRVSTESKKPKLTNRQSAALEKITRNITAKQTSLPKPPTKMLKKPAKLPRGNAILKAQTAAKLAPKKTTKKDNFDVWSKDLTPKVDNLDNELAAEHYLKIVKKKQPKTPAKSITSLLPNVEVAKPGASYNPEESEYVEYVTKIAQDEQKLIDQEAKIKRGINPQWEKVATEHERFLEMAEGLHIHPKFDQTDGDDSEEKPDDEKTFTSEVVKCDRLTKEQKKKKEKAEKLDKSEKRRLEEKAKEVDSHNVYRTKQLHKELDEEAKRIHSAAEQRKKQKLLQKLTKRQRLGKGNFTEAEDPFLLQEELTGSLRTVKPQGHILDDRMKSLQRRNMLPIGGEKEKKLKKSLKRKIVEKRSVKAVVKGSRVI
uniref:Ribosome biogenesis protein NOP53 n=1 Tax=Caenorhabditis japonica TaxID=281687 RepID=A0A8R1DX87_CAEJA